MSTEFTARIAATRLQPQLVEHYAHHIERRVVATNPSYNAFRHEIRVAVFVPATVSRRTYRLKLNRS